MIKPALLLVPCLLAASQSDAEIYRWVDAEGQTHFSDRRPADPHVQILVPETGAPPAEATPEDAPQDEAPDPGPYRVLDILTPADGAVLEQPTDDLAITLSIDPPPIVGHRLELLLDGAPIALDAGTTRWQINGVGFATHELQVQVLDTAEAVIARTPTHQVELRRALPPGVLP